MLQLKNWIPKDTCSIMIGMCTQNMRIILESMLNIFGSTKYYDYLTSMKIFFKLKMIKIPI